MCFDLCPSDESSDAAAVGVIISLEIEFKKGRGSEVTNEVVDEIEVDDEFEG